MARVERTKSELENGPSSGMSTESKELIMRLAASDPAHQNLEMKSIAEAMGRSVEDVIREKERMEVERRLNRIESAVERLTEQPPRGRSNFAELLDYLRNPGTGVENLLQCIGAAIILLVIGSIILWGIHSFRTPTSVPMTTSVPINASSTGSSSPAMPATTGTGNGPMPSTTG